MSSCEHCGQDLPAVEMTGEAWDAMIRCLENGSQSQAAAEIVALGLAEDVSAKAIVAHALACIFSWPRPQELSRILSDIDALFLGLEKPKRFCDCACGECQEHDRTLLAKTIKTITRDDLGNVGLLP